MKKNILLILLLTLGSVVLAQTPSQDKNQRYFDINKNIDIFNSVIRELDLFYVDSLKVDSLIQNTIVNMLSGLDPYTEYYSEENIGDLRFLTTGEYAGIGAVISHNNGRVVINEPYEGLPAAKAGLKAGDQILEVDGEDTRNSTVRDVSNKLKGIPGTSVKITIQRPGESKTRTLTILREKIEMPSVTYSAIMDDDIGYFHFGSFTTKSSDDVREAISDLKRQGAKSLIMDLRGNGGGILDEAVNIVNFFVPKGLEIVSTKGKVKEWDRSYRTQNKPLDELIPIVVLIDTGSASASEIVAGSLQDLDRAVIIGNRSFGKGLVQTPRELPYGSNIKITTSKYYIPSGRLIQVLDYSHRNPDGSVARVPDSLTNVFKTKNGREVRDGGGIKPDITIPQKPSGTISFYLVTQNIIFDFVTDWAQKHPTIAPPEQFKISDADYEEFKEFVKSKDFKYDQLSSRSLQQLKSVMEFEGYLETASEEYKALENKLKPDLERDLTIFEEEIRQLIESEIVKRYYFQKGVLINELQEDDALKKAIEVLNDKETYDKILSPSNLTSEETLKEKAKNQ